MKGTKYRFEPYVCISSKKDHSIDNVFSLKRHERTRATPPIIPHIHPLNHFEIIYLAKGRQSHEVAGVTYTISGGDVLIIRPGETHHTGKHPQEKALVYWLTLELPLHKKTFLGCRGKSAEALITALRKIELRKFSGNRALQQYLDSTLRDLLERRHPLWRARAQSQLLLFLSELVDCAASHRERPCDPWTANVVNFIELNLTNLSHQHIPLLTVSGIAGHFGLSRTRFTLRFKEGTGTPPATYILRRRIELAQAAIQRHPDTPLTDIALQHGFSSSSEFTSIFKRFTGIPPSQVRSRDKNS